MPFLITVCTTALRRHLEIKDDLLKFSHFSLNLCFYLVYVFLMLNWPALYSCFRMWIIFHEFISTAKLYSPVVDNMRKHHGICPSHFNAKYSVNVRNQNSFSAHCNCCNAISSFFSQCVPLCLKLPSFTLGILPLYHCSLIRGESSLFFISIFLYFPHGYTLKRIILPETLNEPP